MGFDRAACFSEFQMFLWFRKSSVGSFKGLGRFCLMGCVLKGSLPLSRRHTFVKGPLLNLACEPDAPPVAAILPWSASRDDGNLHSDIQHPALLVVDCLVGPAAAGEHVPAALLQDIAQSSLQVGPVLLLLMQHNPCQCCPSKHRPR